MEYGKGKLEIVEHSGYITNDKDGWLKENPFGVPSDWEKHVLDRGAPMYRLILSKIESRGWLYETTMQSYLGISLGLKDVGGNN